MSSSGIHPRWTALVGLIVGLAVAGVASPAFAHDELIGTDPAEGSVVETLPESLTLTFSGVLLTGDGATEIAVTDASGADLSAAAPVVDGVRVIQQLSGAPSGAVQVAWRVVSSDGHPISGQYSFSVGEEGAQNPPGTTPAPPPGDAGADLGPLWIVVGIIVVAGAVIGLLLARRRPPHED